MRVAQASWLGVIWAMLLTVPAPVWAGLPDVISRVEPSIVGIGNYNPLGQPSALFKGTGFAVGSGRLILTNQHVVAEVRRQTEKGQLSIFVGHSGKVRSREARQVAVDVKHDLVLLKINGDPLPALSLGRSDSVQTGEDVAFTGFPIGMVLGMVPVTHEGIVSAITPIALPRGKAGSLNSQTIKRLKDPYSVFQLDATAYPGNSGSPVYSPQTGRVVGILNMVFVKGSKESVLKEPSGIAYAIPIQYARSLIRQFQTEQGQ